jgi:hypothetical protein
MNMSEFKSDIMDRLSKSGAADYDLNDGTDHRKSALSPATFNYFKQVGPK